MAYFRRYIRAACVTFLIGRLVNNINKKANFKPAYFLR